MKRTLRTLAVIALLSLMSLTPVASRDAAEAGTLRVPQDHLTIQAAVTAASPGDQIRVGPGEWCGATITKRLDLFGEGATIVGCPTPHHDALPALRIGFFLPSAAASGTTIRHFVFDGEDVSNANLTPLAFGIFARDANHVVVEQNLILGTVQGITATRGSGWTVSHNHIAGLRVFTCDGLCGGGDGIVFQARPVGVPRGVDNTATFNVITGGVPDTLNEFSMAGILLIAQDGTVVKNNRISIPANPFSDAAGQAIVVTDACCGLPSGFLTSMNSVIINNDGRGSEFAVVITKDFSGGNGNSAGTTLRGNFGVNDINGAVSSVKNRSVKTLVDFP